MMRKSSARKRSSVTTLYPAVGVALKRYFYAVEKRSDIENRGTGHAPTSFELQIGCGRFSTRMKIKYRNQTPPAILLNVPKKNFHSQQTLVKIEKL